MCTTASNVVFYCNPSSRLTCAGMLFVDRVLCVSCCKCTCFLVQQNPDSLGLAGTGIRICFSQQVMHM